jgi:hypothetical protein
VCAVIVRLQGEDLEAFLLRNHPRVLDALDRAYARARKTRAVPLAEVEREVAARERALRRRKRR